MSRASWAAAVALGLVLAHAHVHVTAAEVVAPVLVALAALAAVAVAVGRLVAADMRGCVRIPAAPARPAGHGPESDSAASAGGCA